MSDEIMLEWASRLRSGRYSQTNGLLKQPTTDGYSYCCLGVLGEMAVEAGVIPGVPISKFWQRENVPEDFAGDACQYSNRNAIGGTLPDAAYEWAGLPEHVQDNFVELNDDWLFSFKAIAAVIERGVQLGNLELLLEQQLSRLAHTADEEDIAEIIAEYEGE